MSQLDILAQLPIMVASVDHDGHKWSIDCNEVQNVEEFP
jgi:hypothetical protein